MKTKSDVRPDDVIAKTAGITAVLFDLDGTLIDTIDHILASFRHATEVVFGKALPDDVLMRNVGIPLKAQMHEFTDCEQVAEELLREYRSFNHACHDEMAKLYPGTLGVLVDIHDRGVPMGIVTSKGTPMALQGIELFGLGGYFDVVVTSDDVSRHKPDPYPVLHAAALLGTPAGNCAYVGDSPHDVEAGRAAGAVTVAVTWGVADAVRLRAASPDFILDDIADLPGLLFGQREPSDERA